MDKVSPAVQLGGMDKIEAGSWEISSPRSSSCQSPACESIPTASDFAELDNPEIYSVETMSGNPNGSRDSTAEPLTPPPLEVLQVSDSQMPKEEEEPEYSTTSEDQSLSVGAMESYGSYNSPMVEMANIPSQPVQQSVVQEPHSTLVSSTSSPSSSSTAVEQPGSKNMDICGGALPACISFGTHLPPEKQDRSIVIALEGAELWHQFFQAGTEMIITKSGRYSVH